LIGSSNTWKTAPIDSAGFSLDYAYCVTISLWDRFSNAVPG